MNRQDSSFDPAISSQKWREHTFHVTSPQCLLESTWRQVWRTGLCALWAVLLAWLSSTAFAQSTLPFEVSNPQTKKWSPVEAGRIYVSACGLVAREIRPERPPRLRPKFLLVLGSNNDQVVINRGLSEIHLKSWNPEYFAQGVVLLAAREILQADEMAKISHHAVADAQATVSLAELTGSR
jgi:hypothetical protein